MIGTPHGAIHCDVALDTTGSQHRGANAGRNPGLVSRVTDRHSVTLSHGWNGTQVELGIVRRVCAGRMHQHEVFFAQYLNRMVDFGTATHSGGKTDLPSSSAHMP